MKNIMQKLLVLMTAFFLLISNGSLAKKVLAEEESDANVQTVNLLMSYNYDYAYEVLRLLNEERAKYGIQALHMDEELLNIAMYRAGETTIYFDHQRPNGLYYYSLYPEAARGSENIAMGQMTPQEVMDSWLNSEGHRWNMMNSNYNTIGIGCVYHNGAYNWVQNLTSNTIEADCEKPENVSRWQKIEFRTDLVATHAVTWKDDDGTVLRQDAYVLEGMLPYNPETPTKADDERNHYVFYGWTPEITPLYADTTYTAVYTTDLNGIWIRSNNKWWFKRTEGGFPKSQWEKIGDDWYYFDSEGWMLADQWVEGKFYVDEEGVMVTDTWVGDYHVDANGYLEKNKWIGNSYVDGNGKKVRNQWIQEYYLDENGEWDKTKVLEKPSEWKLTNGKWWYRHGDGSYTTNDWEEINGERFHFDKYGYMSANQWVGDYYVGADGRIVKDQWIGNYYVDATGKWDKTKEKPSQWLQSGNRWWYKHGDGSYTKNGWEQIAGDWYYFDKDGWMLANQWIGNYYLTASGRMAKNTWIGNYHVNADGVWDDTKQPESQWIQSGSRWWYKHGDGSYTKNGWEQIAGDWYYFDKDGWMLANQWIGNYYVTSSGRMAKNTWIANYHVNENGVWDDTRSLDSWDGITVYRTPTGKRYHLDPDCGGRNSIATSLANAQSIGLTPCDKCAS